MKSTAKNKDLEEMTINIKEYEKWGLDTGIDDSMSDLTIAN